MKSVLHWAWLSSWFHTRSLKSSELLDSVGSVDFLTLLLQHLTRLQGNSVSINLYLYSRGSQKLLPQRATVIFADITSKSIKSIMTDCNVQTEVFLWKYKGLCDLFHWFPFLSFYHWDCPCHFYANSVYEFTPCFYLF